MILALFGMAMFLSVLWANENPQNGHSFYDLTATSIEGQEINFSRYKNKKLLIVNTASKCGYTPQYADLEKLHNQYGDKLIILGFPANNFLYQEPGSNEEIAAFCKKNYGVTFQMFSKISVKGKKKHPLYTWLEQESGKTPSWNFCKYLIDETGKVAGFYSSRTNPLDASITEWIEK